jgi:outer membrane receptor protein involved in Fe transport
MKKISLFLFSTLLFGLSFGQIKGKVVDATTKEVLVGATVSAGKISVSTQLDGSFELKTAKAGQKLNVSYIGYKTSDMVGKDGMTIELESSSLGLKEVSVIASVGVDRKTPVALSTIGTKFAQENLGSQELPELLKVTPSAFITKGGGGVGDSRINLRGFDQRNIAILINGVPVNDMENGWVYFSNWAGIGDALKTIQVQRGLGASKLAIQSIGGTMNIITKTTDVSKGGSVQQSFTDFGQWKSVVSLSSGNQKWGALSFVGSTTQGNGYINGTGVKAYSYFLSYSKDLGLHNKIQFTLLGAPQEHGQRSNRLTAAEYEKYGVKYNKDLYTINGVQNNININYFHKPIASLNHYWTINKSTSLTSSLYGSFGHGGGAGALGSTTVPRDSVTGVLNMDSQLGTNAASATGSKYAIRNSVNNHTWFGVLTTLNHKWKSFDFTLGLDGRTYKGEHFREVRDLIGGKFYKDAMNPTASIDQNSSSYWNVFQVTPASNRIAYDNDGLVDYYGTFGQVEYSKNKLSAFAQGAVSQTSYGRVDRYNATHTEMKAERVKITGYNVKAGANYNITENHNAFVNIGTYSRAPYFNFIYVASGTKPNTVNKNIKNEESNSVELGYGFRNKKYRAKVNAYYTEFKNRSLQSGLLTSADGSQYRALVTGQGALHKGIEFEGTTRVIKNLEVTAFASLGDWKWKGNASAVIRDENTDTVKSTVNVYSDNLRVGDQPQTQVGGYVRYQLTKRIDLGGTFTYNDNYYAYFDPSARTKSTVTDQAYKLSGFGVMDARIGYAFKLGKYESYLQAQVYNVLNKSYWSEANDGYNATTGVGAGTLSNGFQGWGRNSNFSLKVSF